MKSGDEADLQIKSLVPKMTNSRDDTDRQIKRSRSSLRDTRNVSTRLQGQRFRLVCHLEAKTSVREGREVKRSASI